MLRFCCEICSRICFFFEKWEKSEVVFRKRRKIENACEKKIDSIF